MRYLYTQDCYIFWYDTFHILLYTLSAICSLLIFCSESLFSTGGYFNNFEKEENLIITVHKIPPGVNKDSPQELRQSMYKVRQFKNETGILMQRVNGGEWNAGKNLMSLKVLECSGGRFVSLFNLVCYWDQFEVDTALLTCQNHAKWKSWTAC